MYGFMVESLLMGLSSELYLVLGLGLGFGVLESWSSGWNLGVPKARRRKHEAIPNSECQSNARKVRSSKLPSASEVEALDI